MTDGGTATRTGAPADGYRQVVESTSGYAILVISCDGYIASWPDTAQLYGYDAEEVLDEPFDRLWAKRDGSRETVEGLLYEAHYGPTETEQWHACADGSTFWSTCLISPFLRGGLQGYTVVSYGTTARKQYERMLERQNDRLKAFRHPLARPPRAAQRRRRTARTVPRDRRRGTPLDRRGHDRSDGDPHRGPAPGRPAGDGHSEPRADRHRATRSDRRAGAIPETRTLRYDPVPKLMADGEKLCQLFENLFRNSVEHGGEDVVIGVGPIEDGFFVEDDEPGIPESVRPEMFDHGFRTRAGGSGFGRHLRILLSLSLAGIEQA